MEPRILTYTGKHVNPLDLQFEDIDIRDIAHALACCNRFAGHCQRPISVAQHSVYVSRLCTRVDRRFAIQALFHDASEAYLGDITKWLKGTPEFAAYREAEDRIQAQIYLRFDCPTVMHPLVAEADKLMLRFEGEMAFGYTHWKTWLDRPDIAGRGYTLVTLEESARIGPWGFWTWQAAERGFLDRARSLGLRIPAQTGRKRPALRRAATGARVRTSGGRRSGDLRN